MRVNIFSGLRWASYLFFIQALLAGASYLTACGFFKTVVCSVQTGAQWVLGHPVFSLYLWLFPALGFFIGAFGGLLTAMISASFKKMSSRSKNLLAWLGIFLLVAAFAFWCLSETYYLLRQ